MTSSHSYQSTQTLITQLRAQKLSSVDLVEESIRRIEQFDGEINAVVVRDFDRAREAAKRADQALARGDEGKLLGVPITVKESYAVASLPKTWGVVSQRNYVDDHDAVIVARLKKEGAIILGKTNVPFMLGDWQSYNDVYGVTRNPWNLSTTPGGSSGGSAAAIAAGYVSLDMGSDLYGSLRVPAHFCGVYSHNPSFGLVPHRGHEPPGVPFLSVGRGKDFSVNGPFARNARDLQLALDIIAGPDDDVATAYKLALPPSRHNRLEDFRVLMLTDHPYLKLSRDVERGMDDCAMHLTNLGIDVKRSAHSLIDLEKITQIYLHQLMAVLAVDMSDDDYKNAQAEAKKYSAYDTTLEAICARGLVCSNRDFARMNRTRLQLQHQWRELFKNFDVVLCPVAPITAFAHDHAPNMNARTLMVDDRVINYGEVGTWCTTPTLTGQPTTVMPIGLSRDNMPMGMQIIGPYLEDLTTIEFAHCLEQSFGGFIAPPLTM